MYALYGVGRKGIDYIGIKLSQKRANNESTTENQEL